MEHLWLLKSKITKNIPLGPHHDMYNETSASIPTETHSLALPHAEAGSPTFERLFFNQGSLDGGYQRRKSYSVKTGLFTSREVK